MSGHKVMSPESEFARVRLTLLRDWDPVGVASMTDYDETTDDEYDGYARHIVGLIAKRSSTQELLVHLGWAVTDHMGLSIFDDRKAHGVVELLVGSH